MPCPVDEFRAVSDGLGSPSYAVEFKVYSVRGLDVENQPRDAVSCRGLRLFRCTVPLVFQRFPVRYYVTDQRMDMNVGRLVAEDTSDFSAAIEMEWRAKIGDETIGRSRRRTHSLRTRTREADLSRGRAR